jgi:putative MATE family efflux protein
MGMPHASQALIDRNVPLWRLVLILAVPYWAQQFLYLIVSLWDSYLAGRYLGLSGDLSVAGQAAQTNANYLQWFIMSFAVLVSAGATALVAHFWGAHDRSKGVHAANQALLLALVFGLVGGTVGVLFTPELMNMLRLQGDAAELAVAYLRPLFLGLPLQMLLIVGIACLVGAGDTLTGMIVMSGVALLNVPLAWLLCSWVGLPGIAMGTALSNGLGCVAILIVLACGRSGLKLVPRLLWPDWGLIRRLLRISIPAGIDSMSLATGQLIFLGLVNQLDHASIASHGIALRWEGMGYLSGNAFSVAAMTLVGQNLGAQRPAMASRSGYSALGMGCLVMCVMGATFYLAAEPMFLLFCPKPEQRVIVDAGVPALRLIAFAMPAVACTCVLPGALRGAGDTRVPILFTVIGFFCVRLPLAYCLTKYLDWGLMGCWWAMVTDLYVRGAFLLWRFASGRWQRVRV